MTVCLAKGEEGEERRPENAGVEDVLSLLGNTPLPELVVNPYRPGRVEPRCKKRRAKNHPYLIRTRLDLHQRLLDQQVLA
jgi:hypothetical protein